MGHSVSMSEDGSMLAVGARYGDGNGLNNPGVVRVFKENKSPPHPLLYWTQAGEDIVGEYSNQSTGFSVSMSANGKRVATGSYHSTGYAYVYELTMCTDSSSYMIIGGIPVDCNWIAEHSDCLCNDAVVMSHCPVTCGRCDTLLLCEDSTADLWIQGKEKSCNDLEFLSQPKLNAACRQDEIFDTCRESCGFCE